MPDVRRMASRESCMTGRSGFALVRSVVVLAVFSALLLHGRSAMAQALSLSGTTTFASTQGGTVVSFQPNGTFTDLSARLDGVPITMIRNDASFDRTRIFAAPPHA